jgi:hypothetical protein
MQSFESIRRDRSRGNALVGVLVLVLLLALALGGNYIRNYQTDQEEVKKSRPHAKYKLGDLHILAEGYRMELRTSERRGDGGRVATRKLHHFADQVQEFERVQKAARRNRDRSLELAQIRKDLKAIEDEIQRRADSTSDAKTHLERMFRI